MMVISEAVRMVLHQYPGMVPTPEALRAPAALAAGGDTAPQSCGAPAAKPQPRSGTATPGHGAPRFPLRLIHSETVTKKDEWMSPRPRRVPHTASSLARRGSATLMPQLFLGGHGCHGHVKTRAAPVTQHGVVWQSTAATSDISRPGGERERGAVAEGGNRRPARAAHRSAECLGTSWWDPASPCPASCQKVLLILSSAA